MQVYVARYCNQPRSEIRAMTMSTFYAWVFVAIEMLRKEHETEEEE